MSQPAKAQEPSMEEILASIRRIIADDDNSKPQPKPVPPPAPPPAAAAPPPRPAAPPSPPAPRQAAPQPPPPPPPAPPLDQNDVDAMIAGLDAPPGGALPETPPHDILELTEAMTEPAPADYDVPAFQTIDGQSDVVFSDAPVQPEPVPRVAEEARRPPPPQQPSPPPERPLMSPAATAAVDSAFNALAQTVLVHNARTLEDLVREMLRPMLKAWLDDNLPSMVERIVKAEIERVSRGRG
jgi:cell pole-organizing protein PopZ